MLRRFGASCGLLALTLGLGIASPLSASVVTGYDLATLTTRSEHVVAATVEATSARYDENRQIVTDVIVRVREVGKGRARYGETLQLVALGGSIGDVTMRVEGCVRLRAGDEAVLFLERHPSGVLVPVGLSQGVMPIRVVAGERVVMPGGAGLVLLSRDRSGRMTPTHPALEAPEAIASFVDRVRALAGSGAP